jgi:hypothetical protein
MSSVSDGRRPVAWIIPAIVLVGIGLRGYHFLRYPTVWHDEAALLVNVIRLDFGQLLGRLLCHQAAPPLFLWIERLAMLVGGDDVQVMRLVPFLASCAALILMVPVARTLLPERAAPWALFLFACSEKLLWHACEVKPYSLDVLAGVLVLRVYCAGRARSLTWQILAYAALAPFLLFLSYPACFLYGAILIALLPKVWREGRATFAMLAVLVAGCCLLLALGPVRSQKDDTLTNYWATFFPDWSHWWRIPDWIATSTLEIHRYCFAPLGQALALFSLAGGVVLWRQGHRTLLILLVGPGVLALGASFVGSYPYGGTRLMLYMAPGLALLIGAGVVPILDWLRNRGRPAVVIGVVLLLLPLILATRSMIVPWQRADTKSAAAWVLEHRRPDDVVVGNDWTHLYYFRGLGGNFHEQPEEADHLLRRAWVVYTATFPEKVRVEQSLAWMGAGWSVTDEHEFYLTTVLLLERYQPAVQARR